MKYVEARQELNDRFKQLTNAGEIIGDGEFKCRTLAFLLEMFGCLDQISIYLKDLGSTHRELAETYAKMLELQQKRNGGK